MRSFRITKYNPSYRNNEGEYIKEDWTSISDIGKIFCNKEFSAKDYFTTENMYIDSILKVMNYIKLDKLEVAGLEKNFSYEEDVSSYREKYKEHYPEEMEYIFESICDTKNLYTKEVEMISRLILREHIWCKLQIENVMFLHFGYDYYMYIGCHLDLETINQLIGETGLYVEEKESPYL